MTKNSLRHRTDFNSLYFNFLLLLLIYFAITIVTYFFFFRRASFRIKKEYRNDKSRGDVFNVMDNSIDATRFMRRVLLKPTKNRYFAIIARR